MFDVFTILCSDFTATCFVELLCFAVDLKYHVRGRVSKKTYLCLAADLFIINLPNEYMTVVSS